MRQLDIFLQDEEVWRSTDLCALPDLFLAPFQITALLPGLRGPSMGTWCMMQLSALIGHTRGSLCFH